MPTRTGATTAAKIGVSGGTRPVTPASTSSPTPSAPHGTSTWIIRRAVPGPGSRTTSATETASSARGTRTSTRRPRGATQPPSDTRTPFTESTSTRAARSGGAVVTQSSSTGPVRRSNRRNRVTGSAPRSREGTDLRRNQAATGSGCRRIGRSGRAVMSGPVRERRSGETTRRSRGRAPVSSPAPDRDGVAMGDSAVFLRGRVRSRRTGRARRRRSAAPRPVTSAPTRGARNPSAPRSRSACCPRPSPRSGSG